ncbi:cell division protein FtsQ [Dyadobacter jejuensis]|uniref:Cell division protein FtsQ n=1 Tax=Dyadobacter jejuensis TaxID=1082580 RepID=A0A316ARC2_9BACT|nr:cell division protein FtsQ/DivIB [Dyadobacter jejuensis]PWJ60142.1 cell division protein FtsQ [Dyadobacter jejuensis]
MLRKFDNPWHFFKKSIWFILPGLGIGMAEHRIDNQRCVNLVIDVKGDLSTNFLNQRDILLLATDGGGAPLTGAKLGEINLADVEKRIAKNKLIKKCEVFRDLKGNIVVNVEQQKPLARWINTSQTGEWRSASGKYLNENGQFFPLSDSFSARTLLLSGPYFDQLKGLEQNSNLMEMLRFLDTDPFWKAQVTQMHIDKDGEISLFTLLGDQRVEFGEAEGYVQKLDKLRLFYNKVLSQDWGRYSKIIVKFQDQIVCE